MSERSLATHSTRSNPDDEVVGHDMRASGKRLAKSLQADGGNSAFALICYREQGRRKQRHNVPNLTAIQHQDAPLPTHCPSNPFEKAKIAAWLPNLGDALAQGCLHDGAGPGTAREEAGKTGPRGARQEAVMSQNKHSKNARDCCQRCVLVV